MGDTKTYPLAGNRGVEWIGTRGEREPDPYAMMTVAERIELVSPGSHTMNRDFAEMLNALSAERVEFHSLEPTRSQVTACLAPPETSTSGCVPRLKMRPGSGRRWSDSGRRGAD